LNTYTFHINPYDLAFLATIIIGLNFTLLLGFAKKINRAANRFLALALLTIVLWMTWVLGIDIRLGVYFPRWSWLPLQFSLALGPLIYFYVLKITRPAYKFRWKDLLHFSPLLLQQGALALEVKESIRTGAATYDTLIFKELNPVLQLLTFISVITYLYWSHRLIGRFYRRLKFTGGDRYRCELRWLHNLLIGFGLLWLMWIPFTASDYFYYHHQLSIHAYYPLYLLLAVTAIWMAATAFLRQEAGVLVAPAASLKPPLPGEIKQRGSWLKKAMQAGLYYQDPELSLSLLAQKLELTTHELSRIINTVFKKSFNDFINEYRVREVIGKMQDPANDHLTLMGIAYDSGFNSPSTFHRAFKEMTGKTPAEYKKELPSYNLTYRSRFAAVISCHEATPKWSSEKLNRNYMFKSNLKTALRYLLKHKAFSFINIFGLAIGTLCCLYILLFVQDQYSYDRQHRDAKDIYRVTSTVKLNGDKHQGAATSPPVAPAMKNDFDEVLQFTRVVNTGLIGVPEHLLHYKDRSFYEKDEVFADPGFFDLFSYHFTGGNVANSLKEPYSVVLLKPVADKLFGADEPLGKVISIDDSYGKHDYKVTGVVDESLGKSHIHANMFISMASGGIGEYIRNDHTWSGNNFVHSYVRLRPGTNAAALESRLPAFLNKYGQAELKTVGMQKELHLQPVAAVHTTPGYEFEISETVSPSFLYILLLIAVMIQCIACINFMNLSTARASKRAKEVGVRKVIGAGKADLVRQFLGESFILALIGILVALPMLVVALPSLNRITGAAIGLSFLTDYQIWLLLAGIAVATGLLAGSYPAFYLSAFKAIKVIKGNFTSQVSGAGIRRSLVVFQFILSIALITGIVVIYSQLDYIKNKDLGFNKDQKLIFSFYTTDVKNRVPAFINDLRQFAEVKAVSRADSYPSQEVFNERSFYLAGGNSTSAQNAGFISTDQYFTKTIGIGLVSGREFMQGDSGKVLINETLARQLGLKPETAPGTRIYSANSPASTATFEIAGVMKDFNYNSLHEEVKPFLIIYDPTGAGLANLVVSVRTKNYANLLQQIQTVWRKDLAEVPFSYDFLDTEVQKQYETESAFSHIINAFTLMAILISCLGLYGLSAFSAEQRAKEIGVRKVLGASVSGIVQLITKDFVKMIGIAFIIAVPIAWFGMHKWLQAFAYRVDISWWMFALSGIIALLIAMVTVSYQSIKAASMNPVKSLKSE
jgi:putative ABC transport system permease protein